MEHTYVWEIVFEETWMGGTGRKTNALPIHISSPTMQDALHKAEQLASQHTIEDYSAPPTYDKDGDEIYPKLHVAELMPVKIERLYILNEEEED